MFGTETPLVDELMELPVSMADSNLLEYLFFALCRENNTRSLYSCLVDSPPQSFQLGVQTFHKPRGLEGEWKQVTENDKLRVAPAKGKVKLTSNSIPFWNRNRKIKETQTTSCGTFCFAGSSTSREPSCINRRKSIHSSTFSSESRGTFLHFLFPFQF